MTYKDPQLAGDVAGGVDVNKVSSISGGSHNGGVGVVQWNNETSVPTSAPTGGSIVYENAGTLKHYGSGSAQVDIAPAGSGTVNTQNTKINRSVGFFRTATTGFTTAFTYTVPYSVTYGAITLIEVQFTVRDTSGSGTAVAAAGRWASGFMTTSGGSTSQVGNGTVSSTFNVTGGTPRNLTVYTFNNSGGTTFTAGVISFTGSGSTIQITVNPPTGNTYDWTFDVYCQNT